MGDVQGHRGGEHKVLRDNRVSCSSKQFTMSTLQYILVPYHSFIILRVDCDHLNGNICFCYVKGDTPLPPPPPFCLAEIKMEIHLD